MAKASIPVRLFLIENDETGTPRATRQADITWYSLKDALAQPSAGDLGVIYAADATGKEPVALMMLTCEPGGTIASHTGPQTIMCYVVRGKGKLTLKGGEPVDYQPNDCFVLKPETLHGWENGDEMTAILSVSVL